MTQEEKELLLKDICARLPYGVKVKIKNIIQPQRLHWSYISDEKDWDLPKPYLRPMSSMTEEERAEMEKKKKKDRIEPYGEIKKFGEDNLLLCTIRQSTNLQDWLNANHFDYRGLIPMGLALEAPEGMYNENC